MGDLLCWWLAVEVLGIVALPLTTIVFANLPDRGWALAKPLGLLVLGWLIWLPLTLIPALPYNAAWILGTFVLFAAGNAALLRLPRPRAALRDLWARHRAYILTSELLFAAAFGLLAWIRSFYPAVVDTEKFMDVAFLSSLWRTPHLPPPDPWLSGTTINYYYFGHFLLATIAKVFGTQPGTAFNIGIALVFALAAVAVFAVATNIVAARGGNRASLTRALPFGLTSALAVLVLGNLNGAQVWWQNANDVVKTAPRLLTSPWGWWLNRDLWLRYDWWSPSRVVPNTITEFPAFSYVLADLHAHILALPFAALAIGVACNLLLARGQGIYAFGRDRWRWLALATSGVLIGGLYAINGWDLPTYLGLALLALGVQQWLTHGRRLDSLFLVDFFAAGAAFTACCFLFYLPFYRGFVSPSEGFAIVPPTEHSAIGYEFAMFGLPFVIAASLIVLRLAQWAGQVLRETTEQTLTLDGGAASGFWARLDGRAYWVGATAVGVLVAGLVLWTYTTQQNHGWTLFWCFIVIVACAALALREARGAGTDGERGGIAPDDAIAARADLWLYVLVGVAAALVAAAELIYLRDIFSSRMNTVFKLYYQAWLLLGLAAGPVLARLLPAARDTLMVAFDRLAAVASAPVPAVHLTTAAPQQLAVPTAARAHAAADVASAAHSNAAPPVPPATPPAADQTTPPDIPAALRWLRTGGILLWMGALLALVAAALVYPVLATSARTQNFTGSHTLDGTAYMANDPISAPAACVVGGGSNHNDNQAIAWLNTHVSGSQVLVEAPGCEWSHFSRVSSFTGLPTLLGWPGGHEGEWRTNWLRLYGQGDEFGARTNAINTIYTNSDERVVLATLRQYHASLVYVGVAEQMLYPNADLGRFRSFLRVIYDSGGVTIYAVPQGGS